MDDYEGRLVCHIVLVTRYIDNVQYEMDISLCATLISSLCRRIEQLETTNAIEREPPPTLPVNENSRASSPNSLDGIGPTAISVNNTGHHHHQQQQQQQGATAEITAHEDEVGVSSLNSDPIPVIVLYISLIHTPLSLAHTPHIHTFRGCVQFELEDSDPIP